MDTSLSLLHPRLRKWFRKKFGTLTSAQEQTLPLLLRRESVLLSSPTGSGKTLAAFLAIFDDLIRAQEKMGEKEKLPGVVAVYVSPLRALTYDLRKNLQGPLDELGFDFVRVGLRTGDTDQKERAAQRRRPPHILATTPESLALLLSQEVWRTALANVRYLIIDELHALAENKRGTHLMLSAERLETLVRERRPADAPTLAADTLAVTRVGLSATVAPLDIVAQYLTGPSRRCQVVTVQELKKMHLEIFSPLRRHPYPPAGWMTKRMLRELAEVIRQNRTSLLFTNSRGGTESIGFRLKEMLPDLAAQIEVHHASLDRDIRLNVEDRLKRGELRAVVCSTSLELGIDIGSIDLVVMVTAPKSVARALQRIGRSGHSWKETSRGLLVATNVNDLAECCAACRLMERVELEPVRIPENSADVLAQHLVGMAVAGPVQVDAAFEMVRRAYPYRDLTRASFERVLRYLAGGGVSLEKQYTPVFGKITLSHDGFILLAAPRVAREFYQNVGTITTEPLVNVKSGRRHIGQIEEAFLKQLQIGDVFVLNTESVRLVETRMLEAKVKPARGELATVPRWGNLRQPLSNGLARELGQLRGELARRVEEAFEEPARAREIEGEAVDWLVERYGVTVANAQAVVRQFHAQRRISQIPRPGELLIEVFPDGPKRHYFFHTLLGRAANDALSRILAWRVKQTKGGNALVTVDDYGILITVRDFQETSLDEWRRLFGAKDAWEDLRHALVGGELVRWQFRAIAQTGLMVARHQAGRERSHRAMQWSAEVIFDVLQRHEPDHPLLAEAYEEAMQQYLDAPRAIEYLDLAPTLPWHLREVDRVSPFCFPIFVNKLKEAMMMEDPEAAIERIYHEMYRDVEELTGGRDEQAEE